MYAHGCQDCCVLRCHACVFEGAKLNGSAWQAGLMALCGSSIQAGIGCCIVAGTCMIWTASLPAPCKACKQACLPHGHTPAVLCLQLGN